MIAALGVLVGCDQLFELQHLPDLPVDGSTTMSCLMSQPMDSFDTSPACGSWGKPDNMDSTTGITNGSLAIMPGAGNGSAYGGCAANSFQAFTGAIAAVVSRPSADGEFQELQLLWPNASDITEVHWGGTGIITDHAMNSTKMNLATTAFDPVQTLWVRMRPTPSSIVFETSPDGATWTTINTDPRTPPAMVKVFLYGGEFEALTSPPPIYFDGLNCP